MLDLLVATQPTAHERDRAIRVVQQHALDDQDRAELLEMLGLDRAEVPTPGRSARLLTSPKSATLTWPAT